VGLGAIYRGKIYASTDNAVVLPAFIRMDGAVFFTVNENIELQLNVENLFDREYFASAHNNNNITPGAPRAAWLSMRLDF
jgi:catecholate siderophore receptor